MTSKVNKLTILMISFFILAFSFFLIGISKNKKEELYKVNNETDYDISLKANTFFSDEKMASHNYYVSSSIQNINVYFNYNLKNIFQNNISYSYKINATLKGYADDGTKLIWTKDFPLEKANNLIAKEVSLKKNLVFNYDYYLDYVKSFQTTYNLKINAYLYVRLSLEIESKDDYYVELIIPINDKVIEITMNEKNTSKEEDNKVMNSYLVIVILFFIIAITILGFKIRLKKNKESNIIKEYKNYIIKLLNEPTTHNNLIYLTKFENLLAIAENNNTNILNYQNTYYVIKDNICYIYVRRA